MLDNIHDKMTKLRYNLTYFGNRYSIDEVLNILEDILGDIEIARVKLESLKEELKCNQ